MATGTFPEQMNNSCFCISLDNNALHQTLESEVGVPGLFELIQQRCPHLFSTRPVFINTTHRQRMSTVIQAVEQVIALPAYQEHVITNSNAIVQNNTHHARGVFFGYDFHIHDNQLGLIEINTNAGGALLNTVLARAQRVCCAEVASMVPTLSDIIAMEQNIVAMFHHEHQLAGRNTPLRTIAIVDENPEQQYLYAEFLLFRQLFQRHGLQAIITDPAQLHLHDGCLYHEDNTGKTTTIDLVYNRLTDFTLQDTSNAVLHEAYQCNAVTLTPHPYAHALYADKRNLALLTNTTFLHEIGVSHEKQQLLIDNIPNTEIVRSADADRLWNQRKSLFFKPWSGYGSKAAYRGDKITQRVWQEILQGDYVAQAMIAPGERIISSGSPVQTLKFDLRNYVYNGEVQWVAARLYQGQTTNFRTPGGGFAPVFTA